MKVEQLFHSVREKNENKELSLRVLLSAALLNFHEVFLRWSGNYGLVKRGARLVKRPEKTKVKEEEMRGLFHPSPSGGKKTV